MRGEVKKMKRRIRKKRALKERGLSAISYRIKCKRTANGLSHYVPAEKKALV